MRCPPPSRVLLPLLVSFGLLLGGCGDDDPAQPATPTTVSGQVIKGPVDAASVTLHALGADGDAGLLVAGPFPTDVTGTWSGQVPAGVNGPFVIVVTGGSYVDEVSGETVSMGANRLLGYTASGSGQVTPYTHALALGAMGRVEDGSSAAAAWAFMIERFEAAFGFDPTQTAPALGGNANQREYLALVGGVSEVLDDNPALAALDGAAVFELVLALAADLSDGVLDGTDILGELIEVSVGSGTVNWPALDAAGIDALVAAANAFAAATDGLEGIVLEDIDLDFGGGSVGTGSGSVTFSGPAASLLPSSTFAPIAFSANAGALAWAFASQAYSAQVGVTRAFDNPSRAQIVTVNFQLADAAYGWSLLEFSPGSYVDGVTLDGNDVSFENVVLPGIAGTQMTLTVNGMLGE